MGSRRLEFDTGGPVAPASRKPDTQRQVEGLQRQVNGLEADMQSILAVAKENGVASKLKSIKPRDHPWQCENCRNLLGWYNAEKEIMRIRYKQQAIFVRIGVGGFVQSICVQCSEPNILEYEDAQASEVEEASG